MTGAALEHPASAGYAKAVMPWSLELRRIFEPFRSRLGDLGELLKLCCAKPASSFLPPPTWWSKTPRSGKCSSTRKKTLKGQRGIELSEPTVPEPGTIVLVVLGVGVLVLASRCRWPQWR